MQRLAVREQSFLLRVKHKLPELIDKSFILSRFHRVEKKSEKSQKNRKTFSAVSKMMRLSKISKAKKLNLAN
jgi:hypothetical protein